MEWLAELWESTGDARMRSEAIIQDAWETTGNLIDRTIPAVAGVSDETEGMRAGIAGAVGDFGAWLATFDLNLPRDVGIALATLLIVLSLPSIVSAWTDRRTPVVGVTLLVLGGLLALWTVQTYPGDYHWDDVPMAFIEVVARVLN